MHSTAPQNQEYAQSCLKLWHQQGLLRAFTLGMFGAHDEGQKPVPGFSSVKLARSSWRKGGRHADLTDDVLVSVGERYGWEQKFLRNDPNVDPYLSGILGEALGKKHFVTAHRHVTHPRRKARYAKSRETLAHPSPFQSVLLGGSPKRDMKYLLGLEADEDVCYWQLSIEKVKYGRPNWLYFGYVYRGVEELSYAIDLAQVYKADIVKVYGEVEDVRPTLPPQLDDADKLDFDFG